MVSELDYPPTFSYRSFLYSQTKDMRAFDKNIVTGAVLLHLIIF